MTEQLACSTVGVIHGIVSGIFRAAVRDRVIAHNPCDSTKLPDELRREVRRKSAGQSDMADESVDKPDIGCGRFVTRGNPH